MKDSTSFAALDLAIDNQDYERGLELAMALSENYHADVYIQYTIAHCLIQLGRADDAKVHLEVAAFLFTSSQDSASIEIDSWLAILRLLARIGLTSTASKLIADHYQKVKWDPESLEKIKEVNRVCLVIEEPTLALEVLDHAFTLYSETSLASSYLILVATAAHAADKEELEIQSYIKALEVDPLNTEVHSKLSRFLGRSKNWDMASDHIKFIQRLDPGFETRSIAQDFYNLSKVGSFDEQERLKQKWLANDIVEQDSRAPFAALLASDNGEFLLREAEEFAKWTLLLPNEQNRNATVKPPKPFDGSKIRLGYVSPDFRDHAVCHLITDLIHSHNRDRFEVFGYGISMSDNSPHRKKIISNFDKFHSLEESKTVDIVKQIHNDSLDIVIDLAGYTQGFNQTLFGRISGPIKVNYLGYPGTTGHPNYDYILADPIVIPESYDRFYSEKVWRLDCCYQANSPSRRATEVAFRDTGLPEGVFVFCNFNGRQKINRETLCEWQKIVLACPDSVLWLLDPGSDARTELLKVLNQIQSRVFFAPFTDTPRHLGRVKHANLFLDSFPYGAHTTASDAIFSGVPILARSGEGFQSRVSHSIIHYAGLPEMFATTWEEFNQKAIEFYQTYDQKKRKNIENILLETDRDKHPYNINWTTRQVENAYSAMLAQ